MTTILKYEGKGIEETQKWIDKNKDNPDKADKVVQVEAWLVKVREWVANPITIISND